MSKNKNAALGFIFITILIDVIGLGIIIPVIPTLITKLAHVELSKASYFGGFLTAAYAIAQFLFSPLMGSLSDRYGRRPVLFFSLFGLGVDYIVMAFAPDMAWLFVGRVFAGMMGASFTTASAYIADISTPEKRAQNFGMIGVAFGVGFILGPLAGGLLAKVNTQLPFLAAAGFTFLNLIYGILVVPESLPKESRRPFNILRANPVGALIQVTKYPVVLGFMLPMGLLYVAHHAVQSNWVFFTKLKFKWDDSAVGMSLAFVGLMVAIVQGGLMRIAIPKLGQVKSVFVGMIFTTLGFTLFAFAGSSWMMYAFLVPYALGGLAGPAVQGILSNQVPPDSQGELQGISTSLMSLTTIIGPIVMSSVFGYFTGPSAPVYFPGAAMILGALLTVIAIFLCISPLSKIKNK